MKMFQKNKIPHYKLKPDPIASFLLIIVLLTGSFTAIYFFRLEDGSKIDFQKGVFLIKNGLE